MMRRMSLLALVVVLGLVLTACLGGVKLPPAPTVYTVSGTIKDLSGQPIAGVAISFDSAATVVTTDANGKWTRTGLTGKVTVTPAHANYTFNPTTREVTGAASNVDFTGTPLSQDPYSVSGRITDPTSTPLAGIEVRFSGSATTVTTDAKGEWKSPELRGAVTITPHHDDYTFSPEEQTVTKVDTYIEFTGMKVFALSGEVRDAAGDPIQGVVIRLTFGPFTEDTTSDQNGAWEHVGLFGTVTVTALDPAYTFAPPTHTVSEAKQDVNFIGTLNACSAGNANDPADPCLLTTIAQVQMIDANLAGHYALGGHIDASATAAWNGGDGFAPLGGETNPFTGTLDGQGYDIQGLQINRPTDDYIGLFGYVGATGVIRNIGLSDGHVGGNRHVGMLVGWNKGTITNSYNTGSVQGYKEVGGIVGVNDIDGAINELYNAGRVEGENWVGGVAGINAGQIEASYNTGYVDGSIGEAEVAGGVAGGNVGTISRSYNTGTVIGGLAVGGVVGANLDEAEGVGKVETSYNIGSVSGGLWVGGVVGGNLAQVQTSYNLGSVDGDEGVGGVVGFNDGGGDVRHTFNAGPVSAATGVGGLSGANSGSVVASYFDVVTSQTTTSPGGEGKSTADMQQRATYSGWDFTSVWTIAEGFDYPDLRGNLR